MSNNYDTDESNEHPSIKSIFIPDSCLQGSEFPIHVVWDTNRRVSITIVYPSKLVKLKEIYNVDKEKLQLGNGVIKINGFERNGYIGIVFKTLLLKEHTVTAPIKIKITDLEEGQVFNYEHEVMLFRPNVKVKFMPKEMRVYLKGDRVVLSDRIYVKNEGEGTAIVSFDLDRKSTVKLRDPLGTREFIESFCKIFEKKSEEVKQRYPKYTELIDEFVKLIMSLVKGTFRITKENLEKVKMLEDELENAFSENENLLREIADALIGAYMAAVNVLTEIASLYEFLKSLAEKKVILLNAPRLMVLNAGVNIVSGYLNIYDLAGNIYEPYKIQVRVISEKPIEIPMYAVFEWGR